jgi:RHS repeat-associated protein
MGAAPANRYATAPTLDYRYGYNAHGSMTSMPHLPAMDWDYAESLRYISRAPASQGNDPDDCTNSSMQAWYRYDASKQRTRKRVLKQGGIVEERFYLGGLEWYRRTRNGALKEEIETLHLFDGEQRLLMVDQVLETDRTELGKRNLYRYTLSNHLGSSTVGLDENADVISYEEYHPYGTTAYESGRNASEVKLKRYRYTGMERDEESGLNYHSARYYALWLGRWTSNDQNKLVDGPNLYSFVKDNPINQIDTNGNQSRPDVFRQLPPWLQAKIMRGEVNDQVSNAIHTVKLQQFKNVQPRREATWEDHVLNIMTLGGWSIGWTGAGNYDAVSSSPALSDLNPIVKGAMAAGMTAGDVTGTRNIVEGLREKDTLNTRTLSADESFDKVVSGTITAGTIVLTEVGLRNLSTTNFGLKGKPLVTNTMKMASPALSAEEAAVRARINELEKQLEKVLADDPGRRNVIVDALLEQGQINEGVVAELARAQDKTGAIRALRRAIEGSDVRAARQLQGEAELRELESARAKVPDLRRQARANPPRWMLE